MTDRVLEVQRAAEGLARALRRCLPAADDSLLAELEGQLMPRLSRLHGPLLVVVGGSTGVGKSSLVNAVVGREVSVAGVLRPTTRVPVLVRHPDDAAHAMAVGAPVESVVDPALPPGIALLDSPDVDSVEAHNRSLARSLVALADLWLVVTSPARYADAVPWSMLRQTVRRGTATAVVLNRVPAVAVDEVSAHLATLMQAEGLADSPLLVVPHQESMDGGLASEAVAPVTDLLRVLSEQPDMRRLARQSSLEGVIADVRTRARVLAADWPRGSGRSCADEVRDAADELGAAGREVLA